MITLKHLCKSFGEKKAVDDLTLDINPGEILGFLGPNGAGKTTTVKMLTGMYAPTSGTATIAGIDVVKEPVEVKKRIGYVPETGALFESLSAWEYLEMVSELHHLEPEPAVLRMEEFLSLFGLYDDKDQLLSHYSKGMKQKVLLISAFLHNPDVLFLDEPLAGVDANAAIIIKELLKKISQQGKTIMFCSHILEVVERICTRITIIHEGKLLVSGSSDEIMQQTSQPTLEKAFNHLTGNQNIHQSTDEFLQVLERI